MELEGEKFWTCGKGRFWTCRYGGAKNIPVCVEKGAKTWPIFCVKTIFYVLWYYMHFGDCDFKGGDMSLRRGR